MSKREASRFRSVSLLTTIRDPSGTADWGIEREPSALAALAARKDLGPDEKREIWSAVLAACAAEQSDIPVLDVIKHFRKRRALPLDAFVQLLEIAESGSMASRGTTVEALASTLASKLPTGGDTVDLLRRFYWLARQNRKHVRAIVLHPEANEVLCAEIAADTKFNAIHVEIAKRFGGSP